MFSLEASHLRYTKICDICVKKRTCARNRHVIFYNFPVAIFTNTFEAAFGVSTNGSYTTWINSAATFIDICNTSIHIYFSISDTKI